MAGGHIERTADPERGRRQLRAHCDVAAGPRVEGDSGAADRDRIALVWTGMLAAQLEVEPAEALVRLRGARLCHSPQRHRRRRRRRRRHPESPTTPESQLMGAHLMLDSGSVAYRTVTVAEWSRS